MAKQPAIPQAWKDGPAETPRWQVAQATAPAPADNALALPAGVDWDFIDEREGVRTTGYVPNGSNRRPDANSGVTIATDPQAGRSRADVGRDQFRKLAAPWPLADIKKGNVGHDA